MALVAYFYHKTTRAPLIGGSPTALLVNAWANSVVVNNQVMTEVTAMPWAYYHPYQVDSEIDYIGLYDPQNSDYLPSVDKIFISATRWGGGGASINISGIQATIRNSRDSILEETKKMIDWAKEEICTDIEEKKLDTQPILDKIDEIYIPEFKYEEKEAKKVAKLLTEHHKMVKTYIDSEVSEKELIQEISSEITLQNMEEAKREKEKELEEKRKEEKEKKREEEQDALLMKEIEAEFEKQDEEEKEEKRKELEKEIAEKQKELNSLK